MSIILYVNLHADEEENIKLTLLMNPERATMLIRNSSERCAQSKASERETSPFLLPSIFLLSRFRLFFLYLLIVAIAIVIEAVRRWRQKTMARPTETKSATVKLLLRKLFSNLSLLRREKLRCLLNVRTRREGRGGERKSSHNWIRNAKGEMRKKLHRKLAPLPSLPFVFAFHNRNNLFSALCTHFPPPVVRRGEVEAEREKKRRKKFYLSIVLCVFILFKIFLDKQRTKLFIIFLIPTFVSLSRLPIVCRRKASSGGESE